MKPKIYNLSLLLIFFAIRSDAAPLPRVVSLTPQAAELAAQLGKHPWLVAVSDHSDAIDPKHLIPRLGGGMAPSIERIVAFHPDWVITNSGATSRALKRYVASAGVSLFSFEITSVDSLFSESQRFLKEVFHETRSFERDRRCLNALRTTPFNFLAFAWVSPPVFFGHPTLLSDLLTRIGGKNNFPPWQIPFLQLSDEWILKAQPEKVFFMTQSSTDEKIARRAFRHWWRHSPELIPLPVRHFSRASFTPLQHLNDLFTHLLAKDCTFDHP